MVFVAVILPMQRIATRYVKLASIIHVDGVVLITNGVIGASLGDTIHTIRRRTGIGVTVMYEKCVNRNV